MRNVEERNLFIDLYRFLAMLGVMGCHQYHMGVQALPYDGAWIFADFFFILTGCLTARHFRGIDKLTVEEAGRNAIVYTGKKFMEIIPFAWPAMLIEYLFQAFLIWLRPEQGIKEVLHFFADFPLELLMISGSYRRNVLVPSWYLSALFLVFPLFCVFVQLFKRNMRSILSLFFAVLLYAMNELNGGWTFPHNYYRAAAGMLLGVLAYEGSVTLVLAASQKTSRFWLTVIQSGCFVLPLILTYFDLEGTLHLILLCFAAGIAIAMSGCSYTSRIKCSFFAYLGKISMPLYLFHWTVVGILGEVDLNLTAYQKYWLLYGVSIIIAIIAYELHGIIVRKKKAAGSYVPQ